MERNYGMGKAGLVKVEYVAGGCMIVMNKYIIVDVVGHRNMVCTHIQADCISNIVLCISPSSGIIMDPGRIKRSTNAVSIRRHPGSIVKLFHVSFECVRPRHGNARSGWVYSVLC